jgi:hypothetical protein
MTRKQLIQASVLSSQAQDLVPLASGAEHLARLLMEAGLWQDAIAYMAHAIRTREAIWWGWYCARKAAAQTSDPRDQEALRLCEAWIAQPSAQTVEAVRPVLSRAASRPAIEALLRAVIATGDIVDDATGQRLAPPPLLANRFVQVSVLQAAYLMSTDEPQTPAFDFLRQALDVAGRIQIWEQYAV